MTINPSLSDLNEGASGLPTSPGFGDLGLSQAVLHSIAEAGFTTPSEIQAKAIPAILEGGDLIGQACTGSGKTAAFALPIIDHLLSKKIKARL